MPPLLEPWKLSGRRFFYPYLVWNCMHGYTRKQKNLHIARAIERLKCAHISVRKTRCWYLPIYSCTMLCRHLPRLKILHLLLYWVSTCLEEMVWSVPSLAWLVRTTELFIDSTSSWLPVLRLSLIKPRQLLSWARVVSISGPLDCMHASYSSFNFLWVMWWSWPMSSVFLVSKMRWSFPKAHQLRHLLAGWISLHYMHL